ncbi:MAG: RagB/SusD family nutrient uptake outer membrane protein [Reichenbachiella sp.]|uniref:RagB/SusD family nutrient uptake outer membrane protein n=1 Tax=Reichenbachiella sp. TaxID=2184521 RepID=UPI0032639960
MKNIRIIALFVLAMHLYGCQDDFLSPAPNSAISADEFYRNDTELEAGVVSLYDGIQGINSTTTSDLHGIQIEYQLTEMRSDNTRTKSGEGEASQFDSFTVESTNGVVADYYASFYNVIFRANTILENLENASNAKAAQFEGEAKFVRGYAYFNLVRLFGDIPLATEVISATDEATAFTRVATSEVYELIVSDLNTAVTNLDNTYKNRASKAAAQGILAKVHLTIGNYSDAQDLLEEIIASNEFSLEANFQDIFYSEGNGETIFAIGYVADNSNDSQNFSAEWLNSVGRSSGLNYVTSDVRTAFTTYGGAMRTSYSYRLDAAQTTQYQVVKYLPNGDEALGIEPTSGDPTLAGNDWIVLRYADVLLMHVEAILAGRDGPISTAAAINSFQEVRDRAGLTTPVTSISKEDLANERRVELAFENHRLFDLIRLDLAESVLGAFATANGHSFTANDLLLPIPQREINLSKGALSQNAGYN